MSTTTEDDIFMPSGIPKAMDVFYQVRCSHIGEDGRVLVMAPHTQPRKALAALLACQRDIIGGTLLDWASIPVEGNDQVGKGWRMDTKYRVATVEEIMRVFTPQWVIFAAPHSPECGETECPDCREGEHTKDECGWVEFEDCSCDDFLWWAQTSQTPRTNWMQCWVFDPDTQPIDKETLDSPKDV